MANSKKKTAISTKTRTATVAALVVGVGLAGLLAWGIMKTSPRARPPKSAPPVKSANVQPAGGVSIPLPGGVATIAKGVPGDVDGNGAVNSLDADLATEQRLGLKPETAASDVNRDGTVDFFDLAGINVIIQRNGTMLMETSSGSASIKGVPGGSVPIAYLVVTGYGKDVKIKGITLRFDSALIKSVSNVQILDADTGAALTPRTDLRQGRETLIPFLSPLDVTNVPTELAVRGELFQVSRGATMQVFATSGNATPDKYVITPIDPVGNVSF